MAHGRRFRYVEIGCEPPPWNLFLKTLCWKIGESFLKVYNKEDAIYGQVLKKRWELEKERNEACAFAAQAANLLATKKIGESSPLYPYLIEGKLSPGHILQRSKRYAVKLFLSHWHHVEHWNELKLPPPKPYILTQPEHVHLIAPPGFVEPRLPSAP
jgi:hypothetical protein